MAKSYWDLLPESLQVVIKQEKYELEVSDLLQQLRGIGTHVFEQMIVVRVVEEMGGARRKLEGVEVVKGFNSIGIGSELIKEKVMELLPLLQNKKNFTVRWCLHYHSIFVPQILTRKHKEHDPEGILDSMHITYCEVPFTYEITFRHNDSNYLNEIYKLTQQPTVNEVAGVIARSWVHGRTLVLEVRSALNFAEKPKPFNYDLEWTHHNEFRKRHLV
jgi:hypothetical protein